MAGRKKKEENPEGKSPFDLAMDKLNKKYGVGTILTLEDKSTDGYDVISSGSIGFDYVVLGVGGWVKGKLYELIGWEGCLAEDTYIKFINVRPDGIVQDCKGGTIKNLYNRFHNRTEVTKETEFNVISINDEDRVFRNKIVDVVKTGTKECLEIITEKGFSIKATKDHKFYTGTSYVPLSELHQGSTVFIHNNTAFSKKSVSRRKYTETTVKWYYKGKARKINGHYYFREKVHRLVYEAWMNGISYEEYKSLLNSNNQLPINWNTIPEGFDVHHINENTQDNEITNLELLDMREHARIHALDRQDNLRFTVVPDKVKSITSVGKRETYDIKCLFPYNNFIAQGIVVHNSGKSTICGHTVAECQKAGGKALYIDGEHAVDKKYFSALGVDTSKMLLSQPSSGEEGFNVALEMIETGEIDLVVIDSDSSLMPLSVVEGDIGDSAIGKKARLNGDAYPKLKVALSRHKTCVIVISQYREKIGVMFGDPRTTQGGHALKFYTDGRIEVSKSLKKEGDINTANTTKVKAIKNKMSSPYKSATFDVLYGQGINKDQEFIDLLHDYEIGKIYGKSITVDEDKYLLTDFIDLLEDNPEYKESLKQRLIKKIKDLPEDIEEEIEAEIDNQNKIDENEE